MAFVKGNKLGKAGKPKGIINGSSRAKQWLEQEGGWERIISVIEGRGEGTFKGFNKQFRIRAEMMQEMVNRAYGRAPLKLQDKDGKDVDIAQFLTQAFVSAKDATPISEPLQLPAIPAELVIPPVPPIQNGHQANP